MAELSKHDEMLKASIAQRIKTLREKTNLSQSEFARDHLIDRQTLNRWENGRGVTIYTIAKFCQFMEISIAEFFSDDEFLQEM